MRAWATVIAWLLAPPAVAALVIVLGDLGELGWPPPPGRWAVWLHAGDPAVTVVALLRLALVVACGLTSLRVCVAIADAVLAAPSTTVATMTSAPESLRRALVRITRPALAVGLGVSLVSSSATAVGASTAPSATTGQGSMPVSTKPADAAQEPTWPGDSPAGGSYAELRRVHIEITPRPAPDELAASAPDVWVVARGDHLWGIASEALDRPSRPGAE